ncbi:sigma-54 interaction domain-containing protein [Desulfatitalea alkaliphila]|uniref:Sigma 54-interacting transcriptional regulator n=1 Tax=Desulfatitalea alkaliphila TaxID=2929485 RepID=A0AA41R2T6_9BACT|nr:sigma 54-interacting transcriptional regulator [Desulfatitalea alkaliphila]MCJ8501844.1 sigma 54-interacting transcriptional regulator [Desulfatitalea alkaliphila]
MAAAFVHHHDFILDSLAEGVFTVDLDWRITSFNRAAERITGTPKDQAIGRFCFEVFRADACESGCVIRRTMKAGRPLSNLSVHVYRADKRRIPISVSTALLRDEAGNVVGGVETFQDMSAIRELQRALAKDHSFADIVSKSPAMLRLFHLLPQVAASGSTILIQGASGTGKELVARAIHHHSPQGQGPFVAVNCGALPDTLIESELFGHKAGAFTDARQDRPGRFAMAQNGTIFLDEIGDISPAVQVRLLRVLQEKTYEPLGASRPVATNARIVAATHRDLAQQVRAEHFRDDLYYRVNVFKIDLPPLAARKEDIPLLTEHFIQRYNHLRARSVQGVSREAMAALMQHAWPGNVRELENAIEHAFVLCPGDIIRLEDLPEHLLPASEPPPSEGMTLKAIEREAIVQALRRHQGAKMATAQALGIDKNTLRRKMLRLGISHPTQKTQQTQ